jgi:YidC/Oxa1 family membrane protein insertase
MEQARLLIAIVLSLVVFLAWHFIFGSKEAGQQAAKEAPAPAATQQQPVKEKETPYKPEAEKPATEQSVSAGQPAAEATAPQIARTLTVDTPLFKAEISERGAAFYSFLLKKYHETVQKDSPLKQILTDNKSLGVGRMGFAGGSVGGLENAVFISDLGSDQVQVTDAPRAITFSWRSPDGVDIEKTYQFTPDSYVVDLEVTIKNGSGRSIQDRFFVGLNGYPPTVKRRYGFEGPTAYINNKLDEIAIKKIKDKSTYDGKIEWIALQSRYFMSALLPSQIEDSSLHLALNSEDVLNARYLEPEKAFQPGTQSTYKYRLFMGPKSTSELKKVGNHLDKLVNFGMFDFIAKPCVWLMNLFYSVIPNYGVAIIILTILVKLILWPLGTKSYKSMSEMKKLQPLMKEIREKYKNDKRKMNEEVMGLYRTYKINPLGGCLPMIVQLPVFFALYRMLYEAIELRHAPFFLWINDLSAPDRLFRFGFSIPFMEPPYGIPVLTLIMGATMLLQQKMSPPMGDAAQAKMMMFMPLVFTVIFINFSSGLVLYWLVNNILSIAQQYYIQKKFA